MGLIQNIKHLDWDINDLLLLNKLARDWRFKTVPLMVWRTSEGQESGSGGVGWFWVRVSREAAHRLKMGLTGCTCRMLTTWLQPQLLTTQISLHGCMGVLMTWQLALSGSDPRKGRGSCDAFYEWPRLRSHTVLLLPYWKANHWIPPLPKGRGINSLLLKGRAAKNLWTI